MPVKHVVRGRMQTTIRADVCHVPGFISYRPSFVDSTHSSYDGCIEDQGWTYISGVGFNVIQTTHVLHVTMAHTGMNRIRENIVLMVLPIFFIARQRNMHSVSGGVLRKRRKYRVYCLSYQRDNSCKCKHFGNTM